MARKVGQEAGTSRAAAAFRGCQFKFATYTRDSATGMDYADRRYYASTSGRFSSPDPYTASGGPSDPQTWNRYSYTRGDPINYNDRHGLYMAAADDIDEGDDEEEYDYPDVFGAFFFMGGRGGGGGGDGGGGGGGGDGLLGTKVGVMDRWNSLSPDCQNGLTAAVPVGSKTDPLTAATARLAALDRAIAKKATIGNAVGDYISWEAVAAIGIQEAGFRNIKQSRGGAGAGIFQIDLGVNPSVSRADAFDISFAAHWVAGYLLDTLGYLSSNVPGLSGDALQDAAFASYNAGAKAVATALNKGLSADSVTTAGQYGKNILNLMQCF
jgi:RHS repeat-associated protein